MIYIIYLLYTMGGDEYSEYNSIIVIYYEGLQLSWL